MEHRRDLAVHDPGGPRHLRAIGLADALMAQADAHDGKGRPEAADEVGADAGLVRGSRTGGDDDSPRTGRRHLVDRDGVVSSHDHLCPQLAEILHQVVGEGVVVVDDHQGPIHRPCSNAWSSAATLFCVSRYSCSGIESATMPAAAWTVARPSLTSMVRIAIQVSTLPVKLR